MRIEWAAICEGVQEAGGGYFNAYGVGRAGVLVPEPFPVDVPLDVLVCLLAEEEVESCVLLWHVAHAEAGVVVRDEVLVSRNVAGQRQFVSPERCYVRVPVLFTAGVGGLYTVVVATGISLPVELPAWVAYLS